MSVPVCCEQSTPVARNYCRFAPVGGLPDDKRWCLQGKRLFVGMEGAGIAAYDIDTVARRSFASGQLR